MIILFCIFLHSAVEQEWGRPLTSYSCFSIVSKTNEGHPCIYVEQTAKKIEIKPGLETFTEDFGSYIRRMLYPSIGYQQLLHLLETDEYTVKKMALDLLVYRINQGCFNSLLIFSRYLDKFHGSFVVYNQTVKKEMLDLLLDLKDKHQKKSALSTGDVKKTTTAYLPHELRFSELGKAYLREFILSTDHLEERMLTEYALLPEPLQIAVVFGRLQFEQYFVAKYGVSFQNTTRKQAVIVDPDEYLVCDEKTSMLRRNRLLGTKIGVVVAAGIIAISEILSDTSKVKAKIKVV